MIHLECVMSQSTRPPSPNVKPRHQPVLCGGYSRLELEIVQQLKVKDLQKSLAHCHKLNLNERRAGLCNLLIYMRRDDTQLTDGDVQQVKETLKRFFPERSSKLYRVFLEVLHDFIQLYCERLENWIEAVLRRLLDRLGSETLSSLQSLIKRTISSLQHCYTPGFLFRILARIISRNHGFNPRSQIATFDYLGELLPLLQPEDFFEQLDLEACLETLASYLSTTNASLRRKTQDILSVLFDLNPTTFNLFLSRMPVKLEDSLTRSIRRHWAKVIENEHLSPRKTFRLPPDEDMRGVVQSKRELSKQRSLSDLLHSCDSEEQLYSSNEQLLSQSYSAHSFSKKNPDSSLTHSLAVQQNCYTQLSQQPLLVSNSLPTPNSNAYPVSDTLSNICIPIPQTSNACDVLPPISTTLLPNISNSPPCVPKSPPPDVPATLPPDIPNSPPNIQVSTSPNLPGTSPPPNILDSPPYRPASSPPNLPASFPPDIEVPPDTLLSTPNKVASPPSTMPIRPNLSPLSDLPDSPSSLQLTSLHPPIPDSEPLPVAESRTEVSIDTILPSDKIHLNTPDGSRPNKTRLTPSRIPVSINSSSLLSSSEIDRLLKLSHEHRTNPSISLSPLTQSKDSKPSPRRIRNSPSAEFSQTGGNPRTYGNTPSKIPRFIRKRSIQIVTTAENTPCLVADNRDRDTRQHHLVERCSEMKETAAEESISSSNDSFLVESTDTHSKKERRSRVCLDFGDNNSTLTSAYVGLKVQNNEKFPFLSKDKTFESQSDQILKETTSIAPTNSCSPTKSVQSTSLDSSLHLLPSESLEDDSTAPMISHSCHELRTESSASLESEGELRLSSPSQSLKQLLNSFLSAEALERKIQVLNDLRELLLNCTPISPLTDIYPTLIQVVSEVISFSSQLPDRTQLVSIHTLYLLSQLSPTIVLEHSENLARFFLTAHANASHMLRIKLENIFVFLSQILDISLVIGIITDNLQNVTINYLTPLKLLARLIPQTPANILSAHIHKLAPALVNAYTQRVGIQNAALPCLVGLCNCLEPHIDSYLKGLSPSQEKLLVMYVKSSAKKRES